MYYVRLVWIVYITQPRYLACNVLANKKYQAHNLHSFQSSTALLYVLVYTQVLNCNTPRSN